MYSTGVQASWDIVNFQKWFAIKTTEATQKLNEANTVKARYQAYNQLAQTYYSILLTKKYIKICESNNEQKETDDVHHVLAIHQVIIDETCNGTAPAFSTTENV